MVNPLTKVAREIVLGTLWGDGCLTRPGIRWVKDKKDKTKGWFCQCRNYRLSIIHSTKQREYMEWLFENLKPLCTTIQEKRTYSKKYQKWYNRVDLVTRTHTYFTRLRGYYYPQGIKKATRKILNMLTPLSLAVWFMDDGTHAKNRIWIATNSFPYEEQQIIQQYLLEKWNIPCLIVKERNQFKLSMNGDNARKFCNLIRPHIIPSMEYKLV